MGQSGVIDGSIKDEVAINCVAVESKYGDSIVKFARGNCQVTNNFNPFKYTRSPQTS